VLAVAPVVVVVLTVELAVVVVPVVVTWLAAAADAPVFVASPEAGSRVELGGVSALLAGWPFVPWCSPAPVPPVSPAVLPSPPRSS
jgi:hypothetical protein